MYERMMLIRRTEERLGEEFHGGNLPGGVHLYIGQEAVGVGVCAHLTDQDKITSTHRGHGHYLAKGGDPAKMIAEVFGKEDGICGGLGGSMHVADFSIGIIGANGIVGAGLPISTGAALAAQLDGDGKVVVCFFGDGAANQGVLMESMNIASLWKLPLIYVCEHNGFSEFSPSDTVTSGNIWERAKPFGIPTSEIVGNDIVEVWRAMDEAVERARAGEGPSFIQAKTYRIRGHFEAEALFLSEPYRSEDEITFWQQRDPIEHLKQHLLLGDISDDSELEEIDMRITRLVSEAAEAAASYDFPPEESALKFSLNVQSRGS